MERKVVVAVRGSSEAYEGLAQVLLQVEVAWTCPGVYTRLAGNQEVQEVRSVKYIELALLHCSPFLLVATWQSCDKHRSCHLSQAEA